jgi:hypothetical protein
VTAEDPIEYRLPGIAQVQVNDKTGLTFAASAASVHLTSRSRRESRSRFKAPSSARGSAHGGRWTFNIDVSCEFWAIL